jgi:hypothetical protein
MSPVPSGAETLFHVLLRRKREEYGLYACRAEKMLQNQARNPIPPLSDVCVQKTSFPAVDVYRCIGCMEEEGNLTKAFSSRSLIPPFKRV